MKMILMRGLPGSGKSYRAKELAGENGVVLSTDDFFMVDGQYKFAPKFLPAAHAWNQQNADLIMASKVETVVIDNTNTQLWEMRPYVELATKHGYDIEIRHSCTPWATDAEECFKRNTHGVPLEAIKRMRDRYQVVNDIKEIREAVRP